MLAGVPKCERAVMCLLEKMHTLNKLHSGLSYIVLLAVCSMLMN